MQYRDRLRQAPALLRQPGVAITLFAQCAVLVTSFMALRLSARVYGPTGFGEFAVARRVISIVTFPLLFGLGTSIPRYMTYTKQGDSARRGGTYLTAAVVLALPVIIVFALTFLLAQSALARVFFGDSGLYYMMPPIVCAVIGSYMQTIAYGYFIGRRRFMAAGLLQIANVGIVPVVSVILSRGSPAAALALTGILSLLAVALSSRWILRDMDMEAIDRKALRVAAQNLLRYGIPRIPGELSLFGFFAVPTIIVAHRGGLEAAGYLAFGLSLVQLIISPFAAVGTITLTTVSKMAAMGTWERIRAFVRRILLASLVLTGLVVIVGEAASGAIVRFFALPNALPETRWLILAAIPYVVYITLRQPLDAVQVRPNNAINLWLAFTLLVGVLWFGGSYIGPGPIQFLAFAALGILSALSWGRILSRLRQRDDNGKSDRTPITIIGHRQADGIYGS